MSALDEIEHAIRLVEQVVEDGNGLTAAVVMSIDNMCRFDSGQGQCRQPIEKVVVIYDKDATKGSHVHAATYCRHHAELAEKAIKAVRERRANEAMTKVKGLCS